MAIPSDDEQHATLDDLLAAWTTNPLQWMPRLYVYSTNSTGRTPGNSLGPIELMTPVDEASIWRAVAGRLGGPGRVVVRLMPKGSGVGALSGVVALDDATFAVWGPKQQQQQQQQQQYQQQPAALPPTDLVGVVLQSMQSQQAMMMSLMTSLLTPKTDPAVEVLKAEIARLSEQMRMPVKEEKAARDELIQLGKELAGASSGNNAALFGMLTGPIDRLTGVIEKVAGTRSEIELAKVQTQQLIAASRARAAGVPLEPADGSTGDDVEIASTTTAPNA